MWRPLRQILVIHQNFQLFSIKADPGYAIFLLILVVNDGCYCRVARRGFDKCDTAFKSLADISRLKDKVHCLMRKELNLQTYDRIVASSMGVPAALPAWSPGASSPVE